MSILNIAVIGYGVGEQHAAAYASHPGCTIAAVCDRSPEKRALAQAKYPHAKITGDAKEILENPAIQVVSIASNDDDHYEQVMMALQARKHVFVEKPLCRSIQELHNIKAAWRRSKRIHLASNLVLRAAPLYQWVQARNEQGEFGTVYAFDGDYLYGRIEKITLGWRKGVENYSVMQGGGVHLVDLMLWWIGGRPRSVTAVGNRISSEGTDFLYQDYVAATFKFPSGAIGRITANFGCVHPHQHVVRLFGTRGTFLCDDAGARLQMSRDASAPPETLNLSTHPTSKGALIPAFVDAILDQADSQVQTQHEFDVISACAAADEALATRCTVEIVYV